MHEEAGILATKIEKPSLVIMDKEMASSSFAAEPFRIKRDDSKVIDISSRRKTGRNEPVRAAAARSIKSAAVNKRNSW